MFDGINDFLKRVSTLAGQGGEVGRALSINDARDALKAVVGFSLRVGAAGAEYHDRIGGGSHRELIFDVFDEQDHLRIIIEIPGARREDVRFRFDGAVLTIQAAPGRRQRGMDVTLPCAVLGERATSSYRNGVFELRVPKA